jgi:aminoglycoside phosphotransferase family enzyme/predicted kinase
MKGHGVKLIDSLQNPSIYDHTIEYFKVIETHISWVILTGDFAYKIKKPVDFGFLDFTTLEKRKHYCEEELRLNRQLAPQIYLDVVAIHGSPQQPILTSNDQPVIEYAVKMRQFPQPNEMDHLLEAGNLLPKHIDQLARVVAHFHLTTGQPPAGSKYGDYQHVTAPVMENFSQTRLHIKDPGAIALIDQLEKWSRNECVRLQGVISTRKKNNFVRSCHGDMHLGNMVLLDKEPVIFDRIEFNNNFYFIDVMSEIAFLLMDLDYRQQHQLAWRFLNHYLQITGDYEGLTLLGFYKAYRAMVRAKVDALRLSQEQENSEEYKETLASCLDHLQLAAGYTRPGKPVLLINHGLSGSGKSFNTKKLAERLPAVTIRSDIERKRLYAIEADQESLAGAEQGIYTLEATERTYETLARLATAVLTAGFNVIIDAVNLKQAQRQYFINLANQLDLQFIILHYQADQDIMRSRIQDRLTANDDASDATLEILQHQLGQLESLSVDEQRASIEIDAEQQVDIENLKDRILNR